MFTDGEFTIFSVSMFQRFTNVISEEVSSLALETPLLPQLLRVSFCGGVCIFIAVVFFLIMNQLYRTSLDILDCRTIGLGKHLNKTHASNPLVT